MRRPSLRSQLNQIRLWVRQGRTDAWIAHKLDISVEELEHFKRDHHLTGDSAPPAEPSVDFFPTRVDDVEVDLDELEGEQEPPELEQEPEEDEAEEPEAEEPGAEEPEAEEPDHDAGTARRPRRRGRRGGRRRRTRPVNSFEGTFDHGDEGYGLWLDPAVADSDIYSEHWAGHREVTVTVESDAITIRRAPE